MNLKKSLLCLYIALICLFSATAADMSLSGAFTYSFTIAGVTIKGGEISNNTDSRIRGVEFAVVFSKQKYMGGTFNGYLIASKDIEPVNAYSKTDLYEYMPFEKRLPVSGTYYVTVLLMQYGCIYDYASWEKPMYFTNQTDEKVEDILSQLRKAKVQLETYRMLNLTPTYGSSLTSINIYLNNLDNEMYWQNQVSNLELQLAQLGYISTFSEKTYLADKVSYRPY